MTATIAFNKFGLGGRPDDPLPSSPIAWLTGQLTSPDPYNGAGLPNSAAGLALYASLKAAHGTSQQSSISQQIGQTLSNEIQAYMQNAVTTKAPFRERLVYFWSNHFALMAHKASVNCVAGAFVREAIRPYVSGTFKDMLLAVVQHPGMLYNLTNTSSVGPQSVSGQRCQAAGCTGMGINENLAREVLELHTVGVNAGYSQADVDALAMLLTGWTVNLATAPRGFSFNANMHQPTPQTVMGQSFAGTQAGGIAALTYLATHPLTYQHLATKLVTHFISDTPSASDVSTVAAALSSSGGNLTSAMTALINLPSAWVANTKVRTPFDYVTAVLRGAGAADAGSNLLNSASAILLILGAPLWQPVFPNGYSDLGSDWAGPAQMMLRTDWISGYSGTLQNDPMATANSTVGPLLKPATQSAINAASNVHDKLALLFLSPEFQRR